MPSTPHRLLLALALGAASIPLAQARGDMEPTDESLTSAPLNEPTRQQPSTLAEPVSAADFYFADHATTHNGRQVAGVLDHAVDTLLNSGVLEKSEEHRLEAIGRDLSTLTPGRLGAVLEQLAGSQHANLGTATQNSMKPINDTLLAATRQLSDHPALGDDTGVGRAWFQVLGNTGELEGQRGSMSLQHRTQGFMLGSDWAIDPAWRVGVMAAKSTSDLSAARFKGGLDSWHLGAYAVRQDGPLGLRLGASHSNHVGQNKRSVALDGTDYREQPTGQYNANSQNAFAELGYRLDSGYFSVEPFAGVGYQRYHRDRYTEKGGHAALNVGAQTQQNLSSSLGLRLASVFELGSSMALKPQLSASWKHLYGEVNSSVRQSSAWVQRPGFNSDFRIQGTALDRDRLAVQSGLELALSAQHSLGLVYTAEVGSYSRNQGLTGQWTLAF